MRTCRMFMAPPIRVSGIRANPICRTRRPCKKRPDILNAGKEDRHAGRRRRCLSATDEVIAVAERLGAGVAKSLLGQGCCYRMTCPYVTGSLGLLGTKPSWDLMQDCDTLLDGGLGVSYSEFLPKPGSARGVADRYRRRKSQSALSNGIQFDRRQRRDRSVPCCRC